MLHQDLLPDPLLLFRMPFQVFFPCCKITHSPAFNPDKKFLLKMGQRHSCSCCLPIKTPLRNFLAGIENGQQNFSSSDLSNGLTDHILIALTSGTPAYSNSNGLANNSVTTLSLEEFSDLVSTHSDVLNNANVLLIAAPVQPSDMESLAKNITEILSKADGSSSDKDLPPHPVSSDSNDLNAVSIAGLHVILVTFFDPKSNAQHPDFISIPDSLLYAGVIAPPLVPSAKSGSAPTATAENTSPFVPSGDDPYTPLKPFEAVQNNEALANHQSAKKASSSTNNRPR